MDWLIWQMYVISGHYKGIYQAVIEIIALGLAVYLLRVLFKGRKVIR